MKKRLDVYVFQTKPHVDYYKDRAAASGNGQQKAPRYEKILGSGSVE
ncbi:hypothetical protein C7S13_4721 [Burkholderia cepacia]|nr:hypothetical protein [Burkholderia cepacia]